MTRQEFEERMNDLSFDNSDIIYLVSHNMTTDIFEYTLREIEYIKKESHKKIETKKDLNLKRSYRRKRDKKSTSEK